MTCYQSRRDWHSYVKESLPEIELKELSDHLQNCSECREIIININETSKLLAQSHTLVIPPIDLKINVMLRIDKNKYRPNPFIQKFGASLHLLDLKNWGFSLVAAGVLLFAFNLTPFFPYLESNSLLQFNSEVGKKISLPFDQMSHIAQTTLEKIEALTKSKPK